MLLLQPSLFIKLNAIIIEAGRRNAQSKRHLFKLALEVNGTLV